MKKIPTQTENPNGLHQRYVIHKIVPHPKAGQELPGGSGNYKHRHRGYYPDFEVEDCDALAEYFVMRLDKRGKDIEHIRACRVGIHAYAEAIKPHLPELSKDLIERYPLL